MQHHALAQLAGVRANNVDKVIRALLGGVRAHRRLTRQA